MFTRKQVNGALTHVRDSTADVVSTLSLALNGFQDALKSSIDYGFETSQGKLFVLGEKLDKIQGILDKPIRIHPETEILRSSERERIDFLQDMVRNLTTQKMQLPAVIAPAEVKEVVKEVIKEVPVNKPFSPEDLTSEQLIECANLLPDKELLSIMRSRRSVVSVSKG